MADCTGLENRHVRKGIVGSNPTLSALNPLEPLVLRGFLHFQAELFFRSFPHQSSPKTPFFHQSVQPNVQPKMTLQAGEVRGICRLPTRDQSSPHECIGQSSVQPSSDGPTVASLLPIHQIFRVEIGTYGASCESRLAPLHRLDISKNRSFPVLFFACHLRQFRASSGERFSNRLE